MYKAGWHKEALKISIKTEHILRVLYHPGGTVA